MVSKAKQPTLEEMTEQVRETDFSEGIYMPHSEGFWDEVKEVNAGMRPKNLKDLFGYILRPELYILWKLPPKWHKVLNKGLDAVAAFTSFVPDLNIGTYGVALLSNLMYSIKTRNGGGIARDTAKVLNYTSELDLGDHPKVKKLQDQLRSFLDYLSKFKPREYSQPAAAAA